MSGIYHQILPEVFPYCITVDDEHVNPIIFALSAKTQKFPNGSSFAVTSDAKSGKRRIWLSAISHRRLSEVMEVIR